MDAAVLVCVHVFVWVLMIFNGFFVGFAGVFHLFFLVLFVLMVVLKVFEGFAVLLWFSTFFFVKGFSGLCYGFLSFLILYSN